MSSGPPKLRARAGCTRSACWAGMAASCAICAMPPLSCRARPLHVFRKHTALLVIHCAGSSSRRWVSTDPMPDMTHLEEKLQRARVLVVGDAMLDRYLFGDVERISPEAPVPVVRVTREEARLGGAANTALNVKSLGAQTTLITVVGSDEPAQRLQQLLQDKGVEAVLGRDPNLYTC